MENWSTFFPNDEHVLHIVAIQIDEYAGTQTIGF